MLCEASKVQVEDTVQNLLLALAAARSQAWNGWKNLKEMKNMVAGAEEGQLRE